LEVPAAIDGRVTQIMLARTLDLPLQGLQFRPGRSPLLLRLGGQQGKRSCLIGFWLFGDFLILNFKLKFSKAESLSIKDHPVKILDRAFDEFTPRI
jgi:hypothetical protein